MGIVVDVDTEAAGWAVIVFNGDKVIVRRPEEFDMEEALLHAKGLDDGMAIFTQFRMDFLLNIEGVVLTIQD